MSTINALLNHLKKADEESGNNPPEGYCPNCWGTQEYGGKFYEAARNYNADVNTKNPNLGWVQDYANKHLEGIALKPHQEGLVCEHCKVVYRPEK